MFEQLFVFGCFSQLFGEEDPDQDVSPDTEDPELTGWWSTLIDMIA